MEENVRKEIDTLMGMVLRWKKNYLGWAPPEGGGEFLVQDLSDDISTHVSPYVRRLYQCNHLNRDEYQEFLNFCYSQVEELRNTVEGPDEELKKGFWHMLAAE